MFAAADVLAHVKVGLQKVKTLFFVRAVENQQPFGEQLRFAFEAAFEEEEAGPRSIDAQIWFSRVLRFPQKAVCGVASVPTVRINSSEASCALAHESRNGVACRGHPCGGGMPVML